MGTFSLAHWLVVGVVVLLLFGPKRLAGLGKGLGEGLRNFKKGVREIGDDEPPKALPAPTKDSRPSDVEAH